MDDDRVVLETLTNLLEGAGHECVCLTSGRDVIETARKQTPDVLVLDVMLPGVSGFEICRQIRRDPELYTMPILIVSAMRSEEEVLHGIAQGADDYLAKPFNGKTLLKHLDNLLHVHQASKGQDSLTELPSSDSIKREIQRRISCKETFALACAELMGIREFTRTYGPEPRNKAIRHLSRALSGCGEKLESDHVYVGHMGGGYFIVLLDPVQTQQYCQMVKEFWDGHRLKLLTGVNDADQDNKRSGMAPDVLICVTLCDFKENPTPQQLFETLAQLRHKALDRRRSGIHIDRRGILGKPTEDNT